MSSPSKFRKGPPGKPDLSILNSAQALAFVEQGNNDGSAPVEAAPAAIPEDIYTHQARIAKVSVSLRLPQPMADKIMELAAEETLATRQRITPHDIYVRAISGYLKFLPPKK